MKAKTVIKFIVLCSLMMVIGGIIGTTSASAATFSDSKETNYSNTVKEYEDQLSYLFTYVITVNESNGKFDIDQAALNNTPFGYTENEQSDISHFVYILNTAGSENTDFSGTRTKRAWWDTVTSCVADAVGIAKNVATASTLSKLIKNKDFVAAGKTLVSLASAASTPITFVAALGFFWGCGAPKAS